MRPPANGVLHTGQPAKLRSGEWGARITGRRRVEPGSRVQISTRDGRVWVRTVASVVWRDPAAGVTLVKLR